MNIALMVEMLYYKRHIVGIGGAGAWLVCIGVMRSGYRQCTIGMNKLQASKNVSQHVVEAHEDLESKSKAKKQSSMLTRVGFEPTRQRHCGFCLG